MKKYIFTLFLLLNSLVWTALSDNIAGTKTGISLYGYVTDKTSGEHLSGITIFVVGTTLGTTTDLSGHFVLKNLPAGNLTIELRALGYHTLQRKISVDKGTSLEMNFEMEEDHISLDEVVVSANRNETNRRMAPSLVSVLDGETFANTHSTSLLQGLNFQPGVRTEETCQNCGIPQVRINGLDGHYSQILIDSRPMFSSLNTVYGLEQIPANMIESVEIIRGGGSALFGSSAIGGTINIITREPENNSGSISHSLLTIGGNAFENVTSLNASLLTDNRNAGLYIFGQDRNRQGYDHDGDGYTDIPQLETRSVGMRSFIKTGTYSKLNLQYHQINDFRRGGNLLDLPPFEANIAEQTEHAIHGGALSYDLYSPEAHNYFNAYVTLQGTSRKSYFGGIGDGSEENRLAALNAYGKTKDLTWTCGAQYRMGISQLLFMPADLTVGTEYNYDNLQDRIISYTTELKQKVHIVGGFFQNEWKNDRLSLLIGGRLDKHNLIGHAIFSPRANFRYNASKEMNFRLSWSGGFRAPQTYDEDLHVSMVNGERVVTRLAEDLKEERSNSFSLSADLYPTLGIIPVNLVIEAFYTDLNNAFSERRLNNPDDQGNTILERYNGSGARVTGINLEGKAAFSSWLRFQAGMTFQQSRYDEKIVWDEDAPAEKKMMRTPDTYGYFTASATPVTGFTASLSGNYTGSMLIGHAAGSGVDEPIAVQTPEFFDIGVNMAYEMPLFRACHLQVKGGIHNLFNAFQSDFDKGYDRDSGYIYGPALPRSYFTEVKISF